jgi:hypothetical protein
VTRPQVIGTRSKAWRQTRGTASGNGGAKESKLTRRSIKVVGLSSKGLRTCETRCSRFVFRKTNCVNCDHTPLGLALYLSELLNYFRIWWIAEEKDPINNSISCTSTRLEHHRDLVRSVQAYRIFQNSWGHE